METMKEVSLGFAEFVSQLLHETFDAIISSQNHQLDRIEEITSLNTLSDEDIATRFITEDDIQAHITVLLGAPLASPQLLTAPIETIIAEYGDSNVPYVDQENQLNVEGVDLLFQVARQSLIENKRSTFEILLNKISEQRLIVSEGEIKAKMELSTMYESNDETGSEGESKQKARKRERGRNDFIGKRSRTQLTPPDKTMIRRIHDVNSNMDLVFVDHGKVKQMESIDHRIPDARLIAKPVTTKSSSNLYSEITIKFMNA